MKTPFRTIIIIGLLSTSLPLFGVGKKPLALSETRERDDSDTSTLSADSARSLSTPSPRESAAEIPRLDIAHVDMSTLTITFPKGFDFCSAYGPLSRFTKRIQRENSLAEVTQAKLAGQTFALDELVYAVCSQKDSVRYRYVNKMNYGIGMQMKTWADCELIVRFLLKATLLEDGLYSAAIKYLKRKGCFSFAVIGD